MCEVLLPNRLSVHDRFTKVGSPAFDVGHGTPHQPYLSDSLDYFSFSTDSLDNVLFSIPSPQADNTIEYTDQLCNFMQMKEKEAISTRNKDEKLVITKDERCSIIDWMLWVCYEFNFLDETFFVSVSIFDKMIQGEKFALNDSNRDIQLLGASCIWMASKLQETLIPSVEDFVSICNNEFTSEDFCENEKLILEALNFDVVEPTTETFTSTFLSQIPADPNFAECTNLFMYASVYNSDAIHTKPSHSGLAAVTLSKILLDYPMNLVVIPRSIPYLDEEELEKATLYLLESVKLALYNMNGPFSNKFSDFLNYNFINVDELTQKVKSFIESKTLSTALES